MDDYGFQSKPEKIWEAFRMIIERLLLEKEIKTCEKLTGYKLKWNEKFRIYISCFFKRNVV